MSIRMYVKGLKCYRSEKVLNRSDFKQIIYSRKSWFLNIKVTLCDLYWHLMDKIIKIGFKTKNIFKSNWFLNIKVTFSDLWGHT